MTKTLIALTTGLFLATGASAFAKSTSLDVKDRPERSTSVDYRPTAAIDNGADYTVREFGASNGFGDRSPSN